MSSSTATPATRINPLRARLVTLASDPRVRLLPDGPAIVRECVALLDRIDELERRTAALERGLAAMVQPQPEFV